MKNMFKKLKNKTIFLIAIVVVVIVGSVVGVLAWIPNYADGSNEGTGITGGCNGEDSCWHTYVEGQAMRAFRLSIIDKDGNQIANGTASKDFVMLNNCGNFKAPNFEYFGSLMANKITYIATGHEEVKAGSGEFKHDIECISIPNYTDWFGTGGKFNSNVLKSKLINSQNKATDLFNELVEKVGYNENDYTNDVELYAVIEPVTMVEYNGKNYYGTVFELSKIAPGTNLSGLYKAMSNTTSLKDTWFGNFGRFSGVWTDCAATDCSHHRYSNLNNAYSGYGIAVFSLKEVGIEPAPEPWSIEIKKVNTKNTNEIINTGYHVSVKCGDQEYSPLKDDNGDGIILVQNISPTISSCIITELKEPSGYVLDNTQHEVTKETDNYVTFELKNLKIQDECTDKLQQINKSIAKGTLKYKYELMNLYQYYYDKYGENNAKYNYNKLLDFDEPKCEYVDPKNSKNINDTCMEPYSFNYNIKQDEETKEEIEPKGYTYINANKEVLKDLYGNEKLYFSTKNNNVNYTAFCYYSVDSRNAYFDSRAYDNGLSYPYIQSGSMIWGIEDKEQSIIDFNVKLTCKYIGTNNPRQSVTINGITQSFSDYIKKSMSVASDGSNTYGLVDALKPSATVELYKPGQSNVENEIILTTKFKSSSDVILNTSGESIIGGHIYEYTWTTTYNYGAYMDNDEYAYRYLKGSGVALKKDDWGMCKDSKGNIIKCTDIVYGFPSAINEEIDCTGNNCGIKFNVTVAKQNSKSNQYCKYLVVQDLVDKKTQEMNLDFRVIDTSNPFPGISGSGRTTGLNWCSPDETEYQEISKNIDGEGSINATDALMMLKARSIYYKAPVDKKIEALTSGENEYKLKLTQEQAKQVIEILKYSNTYGEDEALSILRKAAGIPRYASESFILPNCNNDNKLVTSEITNSNNSYNKYGKDPILSITLSPNDIRDIREYNSTRSYDDESLVCDEDGNCRSTFINDMSLGDYNSGIVGECLTNDDMYCVGY